MSKNIIQLNEKAVKEKLKELKRIIPCMCVATLPYSGYS